MKGRGILASFEPNIRNTTIIPIPFNKARSVIPWFWTTIANDGFCHLVRLFHHFYKSENGKHKFSTRIMIKHTFRNLIIESFIYFVRNLLFVLISCDNRGEMVWTRIMKMSYFIILLFLKTTVHLIIQNFMLEFTIFFIIPWRKV